MIYNGIKRVITSPEKYRQDRDTDVIVGKGVGRRIDQLRGTDMF